MIYEKRLLVLTGEESGCLKLERTDRGIDCRLTGNVRGQCVLAVRPGAKLAAFAPFVPAQAYLFSLPRDTDLSSLTAAVGDLRGSLVMSGGFRRPMPWRGNLEDDLRRALRVCGVAPEKTPPARDVNDYFLDIVPQDYDDTKIAEVDYYSSNMTSSPVEPPAHTDPPPAQPARDEPSVRSARGEPARDEPARDEPSVRPVRNVSPVSGEPLPPRTDAAATLAPETDLSSSRPVPELGAASFYDSVSDKIDKLFSRCERYPALEKLLPGSRWIKVDYDSGGRYYLVGLIGDPVRYVCYGVPGDYSPEAPPELAGYCQWLALDGNDPAGKGFWVMYQDAMTGKSIL